jgi:hypothetical protein
MAFIRSKKLRGVRYYSLVESVREKGKVRQRVLAPMGRESDPRKVIASSRHFAERCLRVADRYSNPRWSPRYRCVRRHPGDDEKAERYRWRAEKASIIVAVLEKWCSATNISTSRNLWHYKEALTHLRDGPKLAPRGG